jgi:hypothetical protein
VEFAFLGFTHDFGFPGFGDILNFCLKSGVHFNLPDQHRQQLRRRALGAVE